MSKPYIELFINNNRVYFEEPPKIAMTYQNEDIENPTAVKNSFSKTVEIDGIPENNRVFDCFYDNNHRNSRFNPLKKVPFAIYRNGDKMQEGYCRLDNIRKSNGKMIYSVTLYGGLGEFISLLQWTDDGREMKLSDLDIQYDWGKVVDKDLIINGWNALNDGTEGYYQTINFAPCYNGVPEDFDASKVAIYADSLPQDFKFTKTKNGYGLTNGWCYGELKEDMDEWMMRDLRSYLQRPVIRFKDIIDGCISRANDKGWSVDLDRDFFNVGNQYYYDAWMTLPLLTESMDAGQISLTKTLSPNTDGRYYLEGGANGQSYVLNVDITPYVSGITSSYNTLYTGAIWGENSNGIYVTKQTNHTFYVQLVKYNSSDEVIGGSNILSFYTKLTGDEKYVYSTPWSGGTGGTGNRVDIVNGNYKKDSNGNYVFSTSGKIKIEDTYEEGVYYKIYYSNATSEFAQAPTLSDRLLYPKTDSTKVYYEGVFKEWDSAVLSSSRVYKMDKSKLLNSEATPADYLLSYLKKFNLRIWTDTFNKTVHIAPRNKYYIDEVKDISDLVDRAGDSTITPLSVSTKYMRFTEPIESTKLSKEYKEDYGVEYGEQKIDTGYEFDSSTVDLFDTSVFNTAMMVNRKSKYNFSYYRPDYSDTYPIPPFFIDGCQTYLINGDGDTTEGDYIDAKKGSTVEKWNLFEGYDVKGKPFFEGADGANVLLFFSGIYQLQTNPNLMSMDFKVTDDVKVFDEWGTDPMWIYTNAYVDNQGVYIAKPVSRLPLFSRYYLDGDYVQKSWDYGTPVAIYDPILTINDNSSIFTQYWKPYIQDRYSSETREVEVEVLLLERVLGDWLRRFYYYDGQYWIMNKIEDYDVTSNDTTKCQLIRIQNKQNYLI